MIGSALGSRRLEGATGVTGAHPGLPEEDGMRIEELLSAREAAILDEAAPAVARLAHYERDGAEATRRRLEDLYRQLAQAVRTRDLSELLAHTRRVAGERFAAGFELGEVERAYAVLEAAIAREAAAQLPVADVAWAIALVATAFAHGHDALERSFESLARRAERGPADLSAVFRGTSRDRFSEELVYPV
jgi:hypothetical protein